MTLDDETHEVIGRDEWNWRDDLATSEHLAPPTVRPQLWPDPERGPFLLALYFGEVGGQVECVGIELRSIERPAWWGGEPSTSPLAAARAEGRIAGPEPLTTVKLRELRLREVVEDWKGFESTLYAGIEARRPARREALRRKAETWREAAADKRGRHSGRRQLEPAIYAEVALVYIEALTKPTEAVARWYHAFMKARDQGVGVDRAIADARRSMAESSDDDRDWIMSYPAATKLVSRARKRNLIPPAHRKSKEAGR